MDENSQAKKTSRLARFSLILSGLGFLLQLYFFCYIIWSPKIAMEGNGVFYTYVVVSALLLFSSILTSGMSQKIIKQYNLRGIILARISFWLSIFQISVFIIWYFAS